MKTIYVFFDISGGMNELGKIYILRNLYRFFMNLSSEIEIKMYYWNDKISEIDNGFEETIPSNSADLIILSSSIETITKNNAESFMLVLSDGNIKSLQLIDFTNKIKKQENLHIRTIAVGADSNKDNLKKISTNKTVYNPEDIVASLNSLIYSADKKVSVPQNINSLIE